MGQLTNFTEKKIKVKRFWNTIFLPHLISQNKCDVYLQPADLPADSGKRDEILEKTGALIFPAFRAVRGSIGAGPRLRRPIRLRGAASRIFFPASSAGRSNRSREGRSRGRTWNTRQRWTSASME